MHAATIDLTAAPFWLVLLFATFILAPIAVVGTRSMAVSVVNITFLACILSTRQLVTTLIGVAIIYAAAKLLRNARLGIAILLISIPTVLLLFAVHKVHGLSTEWGIPGAPLLSTIGFSYVFLRLIDLGKTVFENGSRPPSLSETLNYLLPFHMLAGGPIQSYGDFVRENTAVPLPTSQALCLQHLDRLATGLVKKFVIAQTLEEVFLTGFRSEGLYFIFEAQVFYVWLYLDFSAYSDIAVGAGGLLGIHTPENFRAPLTARNLIVFWERWHISLSLFIRRNIFLPIQLKLARQFSNTSPILIATIAFTSSFVACGLWHGIGVRFLLWGVFHAVGLSLVNFYRAGLQRRLGPKRAKEYLKNPVIRLVATLLTFEFVAASLVIVAYPI